jgi:hypothetical protein|tara:strand:- start:359 stop:958 length:600 start_codon:yes stop_codon:yes gene_type:complete
MTIKNNIDIEDLVRWTYQVQRMDAQAEHETDQILNWLLATGSNAKVIEWHAQLGCRVDCAGSAAAAPAATNADAEAVHLVVLALARRCGDGSNSAILIQQYGRIGLRPDWLPGARTRFEPLINGKGKPKMVYRNRHAIACRVVLKDYPEVIRFARGQYGRWLSGLAWVAGQLRRRPELLETHSVIGPAAPRQPWSSSTA